MQGCDGMATNNTVLVDDFRNVQTLVDRYNRCVEAYNDYLQAQKTEDTDAANNAIDIAGTKLGSLCEIIVKHLLYNYYLMRIHSTKTTQERQFFTDACQFKKTLDNRTLNKTFHDLWTELCGYIGLQLSSHGLYTNSKIDDFMLREELSNGSKHSGEYPKPTAFQSIFPDVRTLMLYYVDPQGAYDLESIADVGAVGAWQDLYASADYFRSQGSSYTYILLTDTLIDIKRQSELFRIPWSLVIDLNESSSQTDGLLYDYIRCKSSRQPIIHRIDHKISEKEIRYSSTVNWLQVNGDINDPNDEPMDDKTLARRKIQRYFHGFLELFHERYPNPIVVIIGDCIKYSISVQKILDELNSVYDGSDVFFKALSGCANITLQTDYYDHFVRYDFSMQDFIMGIMEDVSVSANTVVCSHAMPGAQGADKNLPDDLYDEIRDCLEPVYIGIEDQESAMTSFDDPINFYLGKQTITWSMLKNGVDLIRNTMQTTIQFLRGKLDGKGHNFLQLAYQPGQGGSTFLRRIAFEMHMEYPTILITRYIANITISAIRKIYDKCRTDLLILIDCNNVQIDNAKLLWKEIRNENIPTTVVYLFRSNSLGIQSDLTRLERLGKRNGECTRMKELLDPLIKSDTSEGKACLNNLEKCLAKSEYDEEHTPFILSMYAFDHEFKGIQPYVSHTLQEIAGRPDEETCLSILFVLALSDWAGVSVDANYFNVAFVNNQSKIMRRSDYILSPIITYKEKPEISVRLNYSIRYSLFTEYLLRIFSGQTDYILFSGLKDRIIKFINDSRRDSYQIQNRSIVDLMNQLFISRDWSTSDKAEYSPLIERLVKENRQYQTGNYDSTQDIVIAIFSALSTRYPEEPHFLAHLARYYFYTARDFLHGLEAINNAIEVSQNLPGNNGKANASLYHMKGVGYRVHIKNTLLVELKDELQRKIRTNEVQWNNTVQQIISQILDCSNSAFSCFDDARQNGDASLFSAMAECRLRIQLQNGFYNKLKTYATENRVVPFIPLKYSVENMNVIRDNLDECLRNREIAGSTLSDRELDSIRNLEKDVEFLNENNEEILAYCQQCIGDSGIKDKAPFRQMIARIYWDSLDGKFIGDKRQKTVAEIVSLMEENIFAHPGNGKYVRFWFNAIRNLDTETPGTILESAQEKLDGWINGGKAPAEAYFYRFVVRFIKDFESGAIDAKTSFDALSQCLADLKIAAARVEYKTNVLFWLGGSGVGLQRLIYVKEFNALERSKQKDSLQKFVGKLPDQQTFETNARNAYLYYKRNPVFFRPMAISGRISVENARAFVEFGLGFSYDGLRSYHDSIELITGMKLHEEEHEHVYVENERCNVQVTGHNMTWVDCVIIGTTQQVIINKAGFELSKYDPEQGDWPEDNAIIYVRLNRLRTYNSLPTWQAVCSSPLLMD